MNRRTWMIVLIAVGAGLAVVVGLLGARGKGRSTATWSASATQSLCASLNGLGTSTKELTSLDPQTASKSDYQSAVSNVQSDWTQVTTERQDRRERHHRPHAGRHLEQLRRGRESEPGSASVATSLEDVSTQAQALVTTTQTTNDTSATPNGPDRRFMSEMRRNATSTGGQGAKDKVTARSSQAGRVAQLTVDERAAQGGRRLGPRSPRSRACSLGARGPARTQPLLPASGRRRAARAGTGT